MKKRILVDQIVNKERDSKKFTAAFDVYEICAIN